MKILCFGSLNLDQVYQVPYFVRPGETMAATELNTFCGGKGLNQSIALSRAGAEVYHAGAVGKADGEVLVETLERNGVDCKLIRRLSCPTGHAIIQVNNEGQNCILLFGGANQQITHEQIDETLSHFAPGDILVLQNEISHLSYLMESAGKKGLTIIFNPSPMTPTLQKMPLSYVSYFLLNEVEAKDLCEEDAPDDQYPELLLNKYPESHIVLTLGSRGCIYQDKFHKLTIPAKKVKAVDTTAAGDTFSGYFIAGISAGKSVQQALEEATTAAAISVGRKGASVSIPTKEEVLQAKF